jgi:hypothetical protein
METQEERRARNEVTFRAGNEAIVKNVGAPDSPETQAFICECGSDSCLEPIHLTAAEYEAVRANPTRFAVVPGHEDDDERRIDAFDRFTLVEKTGDGAKIVRDTDPRQ